jgi:tetratricopeptide (TPR) repeat protein
MPWPHFSRALALHERGATAEAQRAYRVAMRMEPQQASAAYSNLGMLLTERRDEALFCSESAVRLSPASPDVLYNLANAQMQAGRNSEAAAMYRHVLQWRGNHAASYHNLAVLARQDGDDADALRLFRLALACGPVRARRPHALCRPALPSQVFLHKHSPCLHRCARPRWHHWAERRPCSATWRHQDCRS